MNLDNYFWYFIGDSIGSFLDPLWMRISKTTEIDIGIGEEVSNSIIDSVWVSVRRKLETYDFTN